MVASEGGFSLIEVLVSLALLSLAAISGFILIDSLSRVHTRIDERYARLEALQMFLSDFSQDVSAAEIATLAPGGSSLTLRTEVCDGAIQYAVRSGSLVREVPGCPEFRFELRGIADARFSVVSAGGQIKVMSPPQGDPGQPARAVRIDMTFDERTPGLNLHRIVDLPEGPAS
jgi:general secretion pathway protein J